MYLPTLSERSSVLEFLHTSTAMAYRNKNSGPPKANRRTPSAPITNLINMEPKVCQKSFKMVAKGASKEILGEKLVQEAGRGARGETTFGELGTQKEDKVDMITKMLLRGHLGRIPRARSRGF